MCGRGYSVGCSKNMRIAVVNYSVPNCGVHQYASNLFEVLRRSRRFEFSYFPISTLEDLDQTARRADCGLMLINYHPQTMPFLQIETAQRYDVPCVALMHEMTQKAADSLPAGFFQYYAMGDPTLIERNPRILKTGRLIPQFDNSKPLPAKPTIG